MKKIIFLASGGGGNLKFIHKYSLEFPNLYNICYLIADRNCGAIDYANDNDIPNSIHSFKRNTDDDKLLISEISNINPDIIITNVHKILSTRVVNVFSGRLLNLHYSHLPAFGGLIGMKTVDKAIQRGNLFIGCTAHYVDEGVDTGISISQGFVINNESENIYQSVFECGAFTLLTAILKIIGLADENYKLFNHIIISPSSTFIDFTVAQKIFNELKEIK